MDDSWSGHVRHANAFTHFIIEYVLLLCNGCSTIAGSKDWLIGNLLSCCEEYGIQVGH